MRFKEESGLPWAEIARRLGTYPDTVKRWWKEGVRPHFRHQMALLDRARASGKRIGATSGAGSGTGGPVPAHGLN